MSYYKRVKEEVIKWLYRNKARSNNISLKIEPHKVNLREWSVSHTGLDYVNRSKPYNLGDTLSQVVVEWMLDRKDLSFDMNVRKTTQLFAIGSGITHSYADATIWGNGIEYEPVNKIIRILHSSSLRKLDVRAIRGPLSRKSVVKSWS